MSTRDTRAPVAPRTSDGERLRALVDGMPLALALFDERRRLLHANRLYCDLAGCELPNCVGRELAQAFPDWGDHLASSVEAAMRGERPAPVRVTLGRPTGRRVVEVTVLPLGVPNSRDFLFVAADVTEREELREDLAEQVRFGNALYARVLTEEERLDRLVAERAERLRAEELARARERRLAAVGQLAAGVMHDVNNALNPILAAAHLIKLRAHDPSAVRDYADRIAKAAETGAATAARVGRFIRQDPQHTYDEVVDLSAVAEEVVAMTRSLWAERPHGSPIQLDLRLSPGVRVRGVGGELREALLNLVQNSLDAMGLSGGILTVATRAERDGAILEVRDTGAGMSPETCERAFEPYFTTKGSGMGLGLSEVYGIVKRHRGRAELESTVGVGTVARLWLPLAHAGAPSEHLVARASERRRILVVEDNLDNRDFMCALLRADGHLVESATGIADATGMLEVIQSSAQPFDVLVTDIGLRDGNGWELVTVVRERWPALRVGIVTGWEPETGAEDDSVPRPEVDFTLRKPVRTNELLARVAAMS